MYIRQRKNASGSTSVFIVDSRRIEGKLHAQSIMVKSFGSSSDPVKIAELCREAESYKLKLIEVKKETHKALSISSSSDVSSCVIQKVGSTELYSNIFKRFFTITSLAKVDKKLLEQLAIMRIAKPMSKLQTAKQAEDFGIGNLTPNKIYRFMDSLDEKNITKLKQAICNNTKALLGNGEQVDILFYDLTTVYFETNNQDCIRDFGFSKDGKHQHVQITMALVVTKHGLPLAYELFPGNVYEGHTLIPVLNKLRTTYNIDQTCVVADSALMNNVNLNELNANNFGYIIAARVRNMNKKLTAQILSLDGYIDCGNDMRYKVIQLEDDMRSFISVYSAVRARKDGYEREKSITKAAKHIGSSVKGKLTGSLKKPYFTLSKDAQIQLDAQKVEEMAKLDGYFGFYTNGEILSKDAAKTVAAESIEPTELRGQESKEPESTEPKLVRFKITPEDVITQYKGLWQVEQTFRIAKHNLKIRPVYHWNPERIKAHFAICFLSLSLVRYAEFLLREKGNNTPIEQLHALLEKVQIVRIISKGEVFYIRSDMPTELKSIYNLLDIKPTKSFVHKSQK